MKLVTKDSREIKFKFIWFNDFSGKVEITLIDETMEEEEIMNISYISYS